MQRRGGKAPSNEKTETITEYKERKHTMNTYKLLTPGPLTTDTVKRRWMLFDHCTWDDASGHPLLSAARQALARWTRV